jgi:hypothetical protein
MSAQRESGGNLERLMESQARTKNGRCTIFDHRLTKTE